MISNTLDWITIASFKSISSIERLELRPVNILIGANGVGKSNFIGAFALLQVFADRRLQIYVAESGGADQVLHYGSKNSICLDFALSFDRGDRQLAIHLTHTADDSLIDYDYVLSRTKDLEDPELIAKRREADSELISQIGQHVIGLHDESDDGALGQIVRDQLKQWRIYHVHDTGKTSLMRRTAQLHDNEFLRPDGANLPAFLYRLQLKEPESYALIRRTVQRIAPFFDDFDLKPDPLNEETIRLAWRHKEQDRYFGASALSDGSLRFMFLATLFLQPVKLRPSIILVDEPELGLHPKALALLAALVRHASADTQVIMATQSATLLDHFAPEDVLVAESVNGATVINRLDADRLKSWLEDYSLGQLWEKNELGGRP